MELSVVICTHNPRPHYFSRVLDGLRDQTLDKEKWELLVVDNASREPLRASWDLSWHPHARHIREDRLGVALARQRGIKEISADLLVFVDDDNVLASNYLAQALEIKERWPFLGVWGSGCIVPEFEVFPQEHLKEYLGALALREVKGPRWSNTFPATGLFPEVAPWGAGQCVKAEIAREYCRLDEHSEIQIPSRDAGLQFGCATIIALRALSGWRGLLGSSRAKMRAGATGEDIEICFAACNLGFGMGVFPELKLVHLIPEERCTDGYFLKIGEFTAASNLLLEYKWQGTMPPNPLSLRGLVGVIKHALTERGIHRRMYFANVRGAIRARSTINASNWKK